MMLDSNFIKQALDVIEQGDQQGALALLKEWLAQAAAPDADEQESAYPADGDADGSEGDGAEGVAPKRAGAEYPKVVGSSALTTRQLAICKEAGITPETFLAVKRAMGAR